MASSTNIQVRTLSAEVLNLNTTINSLQAEKEKLCIRVTSLEDTISDGEMERLLRDTQWRQIYAARESAHIEELRCACKENYALQDKVRALEEKLQMMEAQ